MTTSTATSQLGLPADAPASAVTQRHLALRIWLYVLLLVMFAMFLVGGATRLTNSGLSITEWKPIPGSCRRFRTRSGRRPSQIPADPRIPSRSTGHELGDFQAIFWWEWAHRLPGARVGDVFALPLLLFWRRGDQRQAVAKAGRRYPPARRPSGCARLVHGGERPRRAHRRQPISPGRPSRRGGADLRRRFVDSLWPCARAALRQCGGMPVAG